jgi:ABC-type multidrug transport system permease subunit
MLDNRKEGNEMYITDLVWWAYTAFIAAAALFLLYFAYKVREKGD